MIRIPLNRAHVACGAALLAFSFNTTSAQVRWSYPIQAVAPSARADAAGAYDPVREVFVLYGGRDQNGTYLGDTWEYDGTRWRETTAIGGPPALADAAMAWSRRTGSLILFGGTDGRPYDRTWSYSQLGWTQHLRSSQVPPARALHFMAGGRVSGGPGIILYGGRSQSGTVLTDTWEFNGFDWQQKSTTGPTFTVGMAAETDGREIMLLGNDGMTANQSYVWINDAWQLTPTQGSTPPPIGNTHFIHDGARDRYVLFGGEAAGAQLSNDVYELEGNTWIQRAPTNAITARANATAIYHIVERTMMVFGGEVSRFVFDDSLGEYGPIQGARSTALGTGCVNSTGIPSLLSMELPWVGYNSDIRITNVPAPGIVFLFIGGISPSWLGRNLPFDAGSFGMPGCTVYIAPEVGNPFPITRTGLGTSNTWTLPVPAGLRGFFRLQGLILDPAVGNQARATLTNMIFSVPGSK